MEDAAVLVKGVTAAAGGVIVYLLGGADKALTTLIALMVLDYITGVLKGIHTRQLSSEAGVRGITRKVLMLSTVAVAFLIQDLTEAVLPLREVVIMFFVANEGLSILENAAEAGVRLPGKLTDALQQLKGKKEEDDE